jgi:hypothetical protein
MKKRPSAMKRAAAKKHAPAKKHADAKKHTKAKKPVAAAKKKHTPATKHAQASAGVASTWNAQGTGVFNTPANWTPAVVPTSTTTAKFGASSQTAVTFAPSSNTTVDKIVFNTNAPAFTFTFTASTPAKPTLKITGKGVTNNSANAQSFSVQAYSMEDTQPQLNFANKASAGGANVLYSVGPAAVTGPAGGVILFVDSSTAGSAAFTITVGQGTPEGIVGGQVAFKNNSSADSASFTVFGSTSGVNYGDTFGSAVFHDSSTSANATFTNAGGTFSPGDGGNTQFYDTANAGKSVFYNRGATTSGTATNPVNGGDVAFDGTSTAQNGSFHNYAATATGPGTNGGVTSFNNNASTYPTVLPSTQGSNAGSGLFYNYGAAVIGQGGGHTEFSSAYGSPNAANGTFVNYGSAVSSPYPNPSPEGHTILSIAVPQTTNYAPNAASGTFWNFPGTSAGASGGQTEFSVYANTDAPAGTPVISTNGPTAGNATIISLGAVTASAYGGQTVFEGASNVISSGIWKGTWTGTSSAGNAQLIATGGSNGCRGGTIVFNKLSSGGTARVRLAGNGTLDISYCSASSLTIGALDVAAGGTINSSLGSVTTCLAVSGILSIEGAPLNFEFVSGTGFSAGSTYTILTASNLNSTNFQVSQFTGNNTLGTPTFDIVGNSLTVTFG